MALFIWSLCGKTSHLEAIHACPIYFLKNISPTCFAEVLGSFG